MVFRKTHRSWVVLALWALAVSQAWGQAPQGWVSVAAGQNLPRDWEWSAEGQLRTSSSLSRWSEGLVDLGIERAFDALPGWSLGGQWRTSWEWPPEGGWTTSWRWATSAQWRTDIGDHKVGMRLRHQFGGPWMRPWDRARWRVQAKWTHDLPDGWKLEPSVETFLGHRALTTETGIRLEPVALRGRLTLDKKLAKRRHLTFGYQFQSAVHSRPSTPEHTVLLALDLELKKAKRRKKDTPSS
jgi:hypothetical protein